MTLNNFSMQNNFKYRFERYAIILSNNYLFLNQNICYVDKHEITIPRNLEEIIENRKSENSYPRNKIHFKNFVFLKNFIRGF